MCRRSPQNKRNESRFYPRGQTIVVSFVDRRFPVLSIRPCPSVNRPDAQIAAPIERFELSLSDQWSFAGEAEVVASGSCSSLMTFSAALLSHGGSADGDHALQSSISPDLSQPNWVPGKLFTRRGSWFSHRAFQSIAWRGRYIQTFITVFHVKHRAVTELAITHNSVSLRCHSGTTFHVKHPAGGPRPYGLFNIHKTCFA